MRDWSLGLGPEWSLLGRPEMLTGQVELTGPEAEALLLRPERKADRSEAGAFFVDPDAPPRSRHPRGSFVRLTAALEGGEAVQVQVRWQLQPGDEADRLEGLRRARFVPEMALVVGDRSLAVDEASELLASSPGRFVELGGRPVDRQELRDAVELARARKKVIEKLTRAGTVDWGQALELEDEWLAGDDHRLSSLFSESWRALLAALEDGAGVPAIGAPAGFRGQLRPYQERGVSWLTFLARHGLGALLADDMGLGKTVQVLAMLEHRRAAGAGAALVICPTAVVGNWAREARKFVPSMRVAVHQGDQRGDERAFARLVKGSDLIITSYALALVDAERLRAHSWSTLVLDEAQHLKNPLAKRTRAIKELTADACLALTGTPVENRLGDLWSIFDVLNRGLLGGPARFARAFAGPVRRGDEEALQRLQRRLAPFLLRRTKRDPRIALDLPDKQEQDVECPLTREQTALYRAMVEATVSGLEDRHGIARRAHVLAALTHFKQICDHPEVFEPERAGALLGRSGKLDRACELLEELLDEGQVVLIFTQFVRMGEVLRAAIEQHLGVEAPFYHGGLSIRAREAMVEAFQAPDGPPVLIVSLRAGGTGLNLTRASAVFHYDRWWNPAVEDQATDRAHRIGQT
ncbi:MAG: DEAD/DEAH box helicase, partial [Myxococcales bacterium]